jgi:eukaryotic-like serine/threonine-protein kinase
MTEEQIFLAVLDLPNPADRTAYLDKVCGRDGELRRQLESLLAAHLKTGAFLDEPAARQFETGSTTLIGDFKPAARANVGGEGVGLENDSEEQRNDLYFLQSSTRPDSLGRIGHYEVLQVLGKGGFGIVLRAFDDVLQRVVALKVLTPAIAATSPARKRFLREARSSAQVRHENVVQVYAVEEQPLPYLAMEFIPGETLQERLDRTGPLEAAEIVRLSRQIAEGVAAAHATGLIHRDIKPGNVLIEGGDQRVKITDFGLARAADDASLTQSGVLAGTPMYMAPEQASGESLDHRADLFSLGSVMYVMATGRPPFRASTTYAVLKRLVEHDPRPIREVIPEMPQWLCDIIARLQKKKPEDRFQSARELADALAACEAQLKAHPELKTLSAIRQGEPSVSRPGARKWVAAAALLLPVCALALTEIAGVTHWLPNLQPTPDRPRIVDGGRVRRERTAETELSNEFTNTLGMKFKRIPPGKFLMGSAPEEIKNLIQQIQREEYNPMLEAEGPQHEVEITKPFYMGATEVTVGQFRKFIEANPNFDVGDDRWKKPEFYQSDNFPVIWVSWLNAVNFCNWLSDKEGKKYRLPTEAEWEYCCRAGKSGSRYCYGDDDAQLESYAWFAGNSDTGTHRVGEKKPNAWGLYDMHGNVFELCQDWHDLNSYKNSSIKDPQGPATGSNRVTRGGGWSFNREHCRNAFHSWLPLRERRDCVGFRVLLVSPPDELHMTDGT